jgi:TolA-binding protein
LFRTGVNAEKGFDFPGAIKAYTKLVERYPESEHRADALYNVAVTLEKMQQYGQAAKAFARYATTFPSREDAPEMFFRSALVYEKMQAWTEAIQSFRQFIKNYKSRRSEGPRIVRAFKKIGEAFTAVKKSRAAVAAYRDCVSEYDRRGYGPRDKASAYAGQCAFEIAEDQFRAYDVIRLVGTGKKQVKSLTIKAKKQRAVEKAYSGVFRYKRVETTLAALYRIGFTYERFAESLFNAEIPPEFRSKPELADEYKLQLEQKAEVLERKAERAYRKAYDEAIKTKVANAWTQRIREGLNKYQPDEFPVQKEGLPAMQTFTISGHGLDTLGDAEPRKATQRGGSASAGGQ